MGDLAEGMDAGIGAAGALDRDRLAREGGDRLLDRLLHRAAVLLPLPADKGAAVIFDGQLVARHLRRARSERRVQAAQELGRLDRAACRRAAPR